MNYKEITEKLEKILRLDTEPVAVKLYKDRNDSPQKPLDFKLNICQLVSTARYQEKENNGVPEMMICSMGAACTGLIKTPEQFTSGKAAVGPYCADEASGKKYMIIVV